MKFSLKNLEIWISTGSTGPEASENIKRISRKSNGNLQIVEHFHEFLANCDLQKLILIKIKANLMEF